jgi:hypothetical protein
MSCRGALYCDSRRVRDVHLLDRLELAYRPDILFFVLRTAAPEAIATMNHKKDQLFTLIYPDISTPYTVHSENYAHRTLAQLQDHNIHSDL